MYSTILNRVLSNECSPMASSKMSKTYVCGLIDVHNASEILSSKIKI